MGSDDAPTASEIAERLGLRRVAGRSEWRGACPCCAYPAAFVLRQGDAHPLWHCVSCRDRAAITAAMRDVVGDRWSPPSLAFNAPAHVPSSTVQKTARARALWDEAAPLLGSLAERYLAVRGLAGVVSPALRFHAACPHPSGARLPAMLAAITGAVGGELQAVHRTYLHSDGSGKAEVEPQRASLGPVHGGVVALSEPHDDTALVIGEGVETSLAAGILLRAPAWSAISAGNLATLRLPPLPAVPRLTIASDADEPGRRAAEAAAHRWRAEGRHVRIATPDEPGTDFADLLAQRLAAREARSGC